MPLPDRSRSLALVAALAATGAFMTACSSRQLYGAGQAWQQNECRRLPAPQQQRCLSSNAMTFEEYQKQTGAAKDR